MGMLKRISSLEYHEGIWGALKEQDEPVYDLLVREYERLQNSLQLIAAENLCTRAVLAALGSIVQNKTTEGFPRARFHGGCEVVDDIEELAVARAKETFGAQYANVQPHSGTAANQIILTALLEPGDRVLSLGLNQGGHVSHGAKVSFGGKFFTAEDYCVDRQTYRLDYESIRYQAVEFKPKLIICGASAYSRTIDFHQFRQIADEVGAFLMADISHIAGLVIAGAHPSPIDEAHFSTTSTYKPGGPRGGLILMGRDYDRQIEVSGRKIALWRLIQKTTFPGVQGTPYLNNVAAKAVFFKETLSEEYRSRQFKIVENANRLADNLLGLGYDVLTGGTDNHMVMVNIANSREGMSGAIAQECLEECGIVINKNRLPYDTRSAAVTSGLRLGTPIVTRNGMGPEQMDVIAGLIDRALRQVKIVSEREYEIEDSLRDDIRNETAKLCHQFPMC
ncbi:MAG: serine hydroxymethyltransferase [Sedimentisphaerales bacterium]